MSEYFFFTIPGPVVFFIKLCKHTRPFSYSVITSSSPSFQYREQKAKYIGTKSMKYLCTGVAYNVLHMELLISKLF
jgi:hypothetical protein